MKNTAGVLFLVLVFGAAAFCADTVDEDIFSYIPYKSAAWKSRVTVEDSSGIDSYDQAVSYKEKKMRMEGRFNDRASGKTLNQVMIVDNKSMYIIDRDQKSGTKISLESDMNPEKYKKEAARYRNSARKTGAETIDGVQCDIYEYEYRPDGSDTAMKMKEWRARDGFIMKSSSETDGMKTSTTVSGLVKDPLLSDSLFVPDRDVSLVDMDNILKNEYKTEDGKDGGAAENVLKGMFGR